MGRKRVISDELVGWTGTEKALPSLPLRLVCLLHFALCFRLTLSHSSRFSCLFVENPTAYCALEAMLILSCLQLFVSRKMYFFWL